LSISRSTYLAVAVGLLMVGCGGSAGTATATSPSPGSSPVPSPTPTPSPVDTKDMKISVDSTFVRSVPVGSSTDFDLDIQDVGTADIPNLDLLFDAGDRFMDKYTIESAGSCAVDTSLPGLACGKVTQGSHLTFTIKATPQAAGSYVFKFHVDQYKTPLFQTDGTQYVYYWTQTVTS
jgi:hypothetical protein